MADKFIVAANFHVFLYPEGDKKPGRKVEFARGQVVTDTDIPDGYDTEKLIADGLLRPAAPTI